MIAMGKYVVIEPEISKPKETAGGLLLTDESLELRYVKGKVITPGTDVNTLEPGDDILYDKHAGGKVEVDGEVYTVIVERDVMLRLNR